MNFDQLTIERLKYYVYALENGAKNKIFYIGKGKGNRVFDHQKGRLLQKDMYIGEDFIVFMGISTLFFNFINI